VAEFREVDFAGARIRGGIFTNVKMTDVWFQNVDIDGMMVNVTINGVDVSRYVDEELNRRHPERALTRANDADGMRAAWRALSTLWDDTIDRARRLPEETLHTSVDEEWSFVETLRHLVYAIDKWFTAPVLDGPYHRIGLPNAGAGNQTFLGIDDAADPSFAEALDAYRSRADSVATFVATVADGDLDRNVAVLMSGRPPIRMCMQVVFGEAWAHNMYANRDLTVLEELLHGASKDPERRP
jgi:hypothetical protein